MYTLVFDGAPLVWRPNSPAALHLLTLLDRRPKGARTLLALPGRPLFPLPDDIQSVQVNTPAGESKALAWEQRLLPRLAREQQADFLHITGKNVPLFGRAMTVLSPTVPARSTIPASRRNMGQRLRLAFGQGGRARLKAIFWPADLPLPDQNQRIVGLPPCVPSSFTEAALAPDLELPDEFILFHGNLDERTLQRLLSSWSWAAAAIGETTSLLILGADALQKIQIEQLARQNSLMDSVKVSPSLPVEGLAWLYQHCRAVFHPAAIGPWGSAMRLALACGRPLVGWETPLADSLVGPAAYLVPGEPEDAALNRALGAALITVIVEESVAMKLEEAARRRSAAWGTQDFQARVDAAYQDLLGSRN